MQENVLHFIMIYVLKQLTTKANLACYQGLEMGRVCVSHLSTNPLCMLVFIFSVRCSTLA